ncbi:MAG: molybdenum cofactor biosynthesis protein B [Candidatus Bathyarchaeia archaeon]|jgi:molybdenum cofactor biosynthesis protein B
MSETSKLHKKSSPDSATVYIITCSTSKFKQLRAKQEPSDESGDTIEHLATNAGHRISGRKLISDSKPMIRKTVREAFSNRDVDAVIITGGTGLSSTDVTFEAISPMLDREIPGFGEIFRRISFDEIGSAAMMSRAFAGTIKDRAVFCLPGSPNAVKTAMEKLILPELGHLVGLARVP